MEIDPHTLQQILERIKQQMRCPQCGKKVPVNFSSVRVVADNAMLLQLNCDSCNAYIVLHASLQGAEKLAQTYPDREETANVSSSLQMSDQELKMLHSALEQAGGSFSTLFAQYGSKSDASS